MNKLFNILDLINNESIRDANYISLKEILLMDKLRINIEKSGIIR